MFDTLNITPSGGKLDYGMLVQQARELVGDEPNLMANLANISALLDVSLDRINWCGFYLVEADGNLVLGPFQGRPACIRIERGSGVCGAAVASGLTQLVPDVHAFPGHIACDAASRSELVVPIAGSRGIIAVIDIDSPEPDRFTEEDARGIETLSALLAEILNWE